MTSREFRITVHGGAHVGASSLINQFVNDAFDYPFDTSADSAIKRIEYEAGNYTFLIADASIATAPLFRDHIIRMSEGIVLLYNITDRNSFEALEVIYQEILALRDDDGVPMIVVGTKCDLEDERVVSTDEGKSFAQRCGNCSFMECSAKRNVNVEDVFYDLGLQIMQLPPPRLQRHGPNCLVQ
eukprot:TRINITY_DN7366_c0_g1_i1.p1 TRINITY_DN7366_c0_g1~~TRINITY_DN7366_c0_g1_i1.p1  ORF type:complete len:184 (-),score=30.81 TRINITY_DN7366_c0_g1_i1:136-687(-)